MEKEEKKELELFLEDLRVDGINLKDLACSSNNYKLEQCDSCRFFDSCPFPSKKEINNI
ncbi:MAG: hypothetical protein KJ623_00035 [Nanoarchaeota archaeon]|nr:hypothetical protein [Nanoarchaeota archaeon]MBU0962355.1 hypothetical protein [Nanoarchaeota archaeon]